MNKLQMFDKAVEEVKLRAQDITSVVTPEAVNSEYQNAFGYISCLCDLELFGYGQFAAARDLLNAAHEAVIEKTATSTANTDSGKPNEIKSSLDGNNKNVKCSAFTAYDLAYVLRELIWSMKKAGISDQSIINTLSFALNPAPKRGDGK